jgi:CHAT domain-containing protein/Tfp pilus assembly protein PilF
VPHLASTYARAPTQRLALAAIALIISLHPLRALAQQPTVALEQDTVIERRLDRGEEHRYTLTLKAGDCAHLRVEQRGIAVVVSVYGGDGRLVADIQDDIQPVGVEEADVVADVAGSYDITIKPASGVAAAGAYAVRIATIGPANEGDRVMRDARRLRTRATRLEEDGQFDAARTLLEQALAITESTRGPADLQTASVLAELAAVYQNLPDDPKAEASFQRAVAIVDSVLTPDHPMAAWVHARLALLYEKMGQRAKADTLLRPALDALDRSLGTDNRWYVGALMTQAAIRHDGGELAAEETILRRAMAILEAIGDADSRDYAALLNNLGEVYRQRSDFSRAEEWFLRSLEAGTKVLGDDNYFIGVVLQSLGMVARERKDYATAEAYYARVLSLRERIVGPNHPDVALVLNNMATVARARGDLARSLALHLRALSIWEHAAGPFQDATLVSVGNIARTYAAAGDVPNAIAYQRRADAILEKQLALNLVIGSERQKLLFVNGMRERTDRTVSLHLREAPDNPDAATLAALVLLQRKGRVQDAMSDTLAVVRRTSDTRNQELVEQLKTTTAELARLALNAANPSLADQRRLAIQSLEIRKEKFEAELAERSAEFRAETRPVTLEAVQAAIPDGAALLELAVFRPFDPRAERNAEAYGSAHYAAYVVRNQLAPRGFDLGPAAAIDEAVDALRAALRDPRRGDVKARARTLHSLVIAPVHAAFGALDRLLISPDGALNLVPFEALVDEQDRYVIERHAISYLTSGRDLLRMQVERASRSSAAIFADPIFGEPAASASPGPVPVRPAATARRSVTTAAERSSVYFAPLAATAEEALAIKGLFPDATLFTGERAQKAFLQRVQAPRILHIASHGFFLQDGGATADNPLLRSGLALAGANLRHENVEDGILTALEASALDLWGTHLVTLSACDTGIGEVRNGEGVYGLRRAFVLAGTETLVMSLWPVSDAIARETMVAYYTGLRAGLGRGDALRQSKIAMLKRPARQHPFYWASFIQSGEWTPLADEHRAVSPTR